MKNLRSDPTLSEIQDYVRITEVERGFSGQSSVEKCLLLGEEIGELFKAVRTTTAIGVDPQSLVTDVAEELADVLNFVFAIANRYSIDLAAAYIEKESRNSTRKWVAKEQ